MSTRNAARNVRQRKLNTKQPHRIVREDEVEEYVNEDGQRHIPQVETGVEKGEEIVSRKKYPTRHVIRLQCLPKTRNSICKQ